MKSSEHFGFDGLDENIRVHAAADDDGEGYEGSGAFDDDDEEEETVTMTSDDDELLGQMEEAADELLELEPHAEEAIIVALPPSTVTSYTPAQAM